MAQGLCHAYITDGDGSHVKITLWKEKLHIAQLLGKYVSFVWYNKKD